MSAHASRARKEGGGAYASPFKPNSNSCTAAPSDLRLSTTLFHSTDPSDSVSAGLVGEGRTRVRAERVDEVKISVEAASSGDSDRIEAADNASTG